jgi:hypothetical protein
MEENPLTLEEEIAPIFAKHGVDTMAGATLFIFDKLCHPTAWRPMLGMTEDMHTRLRKMAEFYLQNASLCEESKAWLVKIESGWLPEPFYVAKDAKETSVELPEGPSHG